MEIYMVYAYAIWCIMVYVPRDIFLKKRPRTIYRIYMMVHHHTQQHCRHTERSENNTANNNDIYTTLTSFHILADLRSTYLLYTSLLG
jgi:hypothetical protein